MENWILEVLESLGITRTETVIYLDLVKNGESNIRDLAKRNNFHRPNLYDLLDSLEKKGLITKLKKEDSYYYSAHSPKRLLSMHKMQEDELKKLLSYLEELEKNSVSKISVIEGKLALAEMFSKLIHDGKLCYTLGLSDELTDKLGVDIFENFSNERFAMKIPAKILLNKSYPRLKRLKEMPFTEVRVLSDVKSGSSIYFNENFVTIISLKPKVSGVLIEDPNIAKDFVEYFERLWKISFE